MTSNVRGRMRGYVSTLSAGMSLVHLNLLRVALTSPRNRLRGYADALFKLQMESRCRDIEFLELGQALRRLDMDPIHVQATLVDVGDYRGRPDWERLFLGALARARGDLPSFEIGTASGNTTCLLAANSDVTVYTLDLPDSDEWQPTLTRLGSDDKVRRARSRAEFIRANPAANIVELVGDSATFDYTDYHDRIGLFFVDGAHSLEYVRSDTMNAAWCCGERGVVVWDDFTTTRDVTDYVRSLKASGVEVYGLRGTRLAFSQDITGLRAIARDLGAGKS